MSGKRILIVEDHHAIAKLVGRMVERLGYEPVTAHTAAEGARALAGEEPIDL